MVSKALPYSRYCVFIDVTSGHMLSRGSYSTTSICTDLSAACILLTKVDLPSLPHRSACTAHTRLFISSERKILRFQLLYSTCYGFIRLCFLNPELRWEPTVALEDVRAEKGAYCREERNPARIKSRYETIGSLLFASSITWFL